MLIKSLIKFLAVFMLLICGDAISKNDAYVVLILGQSNAVGRAEVGRLSNKTYNPMGYIANPERVKIYDKGNLADLDLSKDDGSWKDYYAGVNSNTDGSPLDNFGPELSLSQLITKSKKGNVYIIKAAFGGTALLPNIPTLYPGNWTENILPIAMEYYYKPAMRDLYKYEPDTNVHFLGVIWWQGENDAAARVSESSYKKRLISLKNKVDNYLLKDFNYPYQWILIGLNYSRDTKEQKINNALRSLVNNNTHFISTLTYPRKIDLNKDQKLPIINTENDDLHSSYIAQLNVGSKAYELFFSSSDC